MLVAAVSVDAGAGALTEREAEASGVYYTFCGHTFTTASCPHPTGMPRVDRHGYPLRASDGQPVDDLGRPVDPLGQPIGPDGAPLLGPDGERLAPAPRSRLCQQVVSERFDLHTTIDGSWYRCCGGQVRKLMDCCAHTTRRINGDAALVGYCYDGRHVFCVLYYDTQIAC